MSLIFKVVSDSMSPLIKINDTLNITDQLMNYNTFDIIIFKRSTKLVVHYIWRNQIEFNQTVITRSLKNIYYDEEPVKKNEIVGLVTNFKIRPLLKFKLLALCYIRGSI